MPGNRRSIVAFGVLACVMATASAGARQATRAPLSPAAVVAAYCTAWNTANRTDREHLLTQVWARDGKYSDPDQSFVTGRAALSNTIADFQRRHPGARFYCSEPQVHHGAMRVTWICRWSNGTELAHGTDFSELDADGRLRQVVGFFGDPPAITP